ncbi:MAG: hypothetical protein J5819_09755 [Eubacterium sp.]|nr:hypothetical protein [Eubacterium sp.]
MLNELKEYEEYSTEFGPDWTRKQGRLRYDEMVKNNRSGLKRAMLIVARRYIRIEDNRLVNHDEVKSILASWCGFGDKVSGHEDIHNWFPRYYYQNFFKHDLPLC